MGVKRTLFDALVAIVETQGRVMEVKGMAYSVAMLDHLRIMVLPNPGEPNSGFLDVYERGKGKVFSARICPFSVAEIVICKTGSWRNLIMAHERKGATLQ